MNMQKDLELHRKAEVQMGLADQARAQCRPLDAVRHSRQAAELEAQVFDLLPLDRPKTRGITAVSSVALYREAGELDEAIRHAQYFMAQDSVADFSRQDLEEMAEEMRAERFVTRTYQGLTPRQRRVLALSLVGLTQRQIALDLGISTGTVQRTLAQARDYVQANAPDQSGIGTTDADPELRQKIEALTA